METKMKNTSTVIHLQINTEDRIFDNNIDYHYENEKTKKEIAMLKKEIEELKRLLDQD